MHVNTALGAETPHYRQERQCRRQAGLRRRDDLPCSEHPGPLMPASPCTAGRSSGERQSRSDLEKGITGSSRRAAVTDDLLAAWHHRAALAVAAGACPAAVRLPGVSVEAEGAADTIAHVFISRVAFT